MKREASYELFSFMVELSEHAEREKTALAKGTLEQSYWQGVADAMRRACALARGDDLYSDLFREFEQARKGGA